MSVEERFRLFGDPTDTLAAEAVFWFRRETDSWPLLEEAVEYRAASPTDPCEPEEAERRIDQAIAAGEVIAIPIGGGAGWLLKLSDAMRARLERRYIDVTMPRRDEEEPC